MEKTKTTEQILADKDKVVEFSIEGLRIKIKIDYSQKKPAGEVIDIHRERPIPSPLYPCDKQWLPVCNFAYEAKELFWFNGTWACERCIQTSIREEKLDVNWTTFRQNYNSLKHYMELTRIW